MRDALSSYLWRLINNWSSVSLDERSMMLESRWLDRRPSFLLRHACPLPEASRCHLVDALLTLKVRDCSPVDTCARHARVTRLGSVGLWETNGLRVTSLWGARLPTTHVVCLLSLRIGSWALSNDRHVVGFGTIEFAVCCRDWALHHRLVCRSFSRQTDDLSNVIWDDTVSALEIPGAHICFLSEICNVYSIRHLQAFRADSQTW